MEIGGFVPGKPVEVQYRWKDHDGCHSVWFTKAEAEADRVEQKHPDAEIQTRVIVTSEWERVDG